MKKQSYLIIVLLTILSLNLKSQVAVNTSGEAADASAMLDVKSTEKGILIPRMSLAQRNLIDSPETGLLIYQTDNTPDFYFYNGSAWVVVGAEAVAINDLSDGSSDANSVFLGSGSGANDDGTANQNTGVGVQALNAVTEGYENTAIGKESLQTLTTGDHNTAFGIHALQVLVTGNDNTALGTNAGIATTGSGNILIGSNAAYFATGINNQLYIENSASTSPLIYGEFDNDLLKVNGTLELFNGTSASSLKFYEPSGSGSNYTIFQSQAQVANVTYTLPAADGSSDQVLKTNGSGSLSWADDTNTGATDINDLSDGKTGGFSVFIGNHSGEVDDGSDNENTAIGDNALQSNTTGSRNVASGRSALYKNNSGSKNVASGVYAFFYNTTGSENVAIGYEALDYTIGSQNTVIGSSAGAIGVYPYKNMTGNVFLGYKAGHDETGSNKLYITNSDDSSPLIYGEFDNDLVRINGDFEVTGSSNLNMAIDDLSDAKTGGYSVFLGDGAGFNDDGSDNRNVAIGDSALTSNTTGEHNNAVGESALKMNTTGNYLSAIGLNALNANTSGNWNCAFGKEALYGNTTASENTAMGGQALSNNTIGHHNTAFGRAALSVNVDGDNNTAIGADAGPSTGNTSLSNIGAFGYNVKISSSDYFRIGNSNVGHIGGQVGWSTYSDKRFKRDINENVAGLDFILKLRPVSYHWDIKKLDKFMGATEGTESSEHMREARRQQEAKVYTGFLAQEVEQAAKQIGYDFSGVETPPNDGTPYSLRYAEFVVPLVKAVQEQQEMIEKQTVENEEMKSLIADLIVRIELLESK